MIVKPLSYRFNLTSAGQASQYLVSWHLHVGFTLGKLWAAYSGCVTCVTRMEKVKFYTSQPQELLLIIIYILIIM